jgi:hypothetical protein
VDPLGGYHEARATEVALRRWMPDPVEKVRVCIRHRLECVERGDTVWCPGVPEPSWSPRRRLEHQLAEHEWAVASRGADLAAGEYSSPAAAPAPGQEREDPMPKKITKMARETSIVDRKSYRDEAGNRLHLRLRLQPDGAYVVEIQHLGAEGGSRRGVLGHYHPGESSDDAVTAERAAKQTFDARHDEARAMGWIETAGRRTGGLTEIPAPAAAPKRRGPKPKAGRGR